MKPKIWDERTKTFIKPSGTVKQGRRPMFKPFVEHSHPIKGERERCAICKANDEAQGKPELPEHSPLPWSMDETILNSPAGKQWKSNAVIQSGKLLGQLTGFSEANAKLIVASVNNARKAIELDNIRLAKIATLQEHADKLAEALREALLCLAADSDSEEQYASEIKQGKQALANWEKVRHGG